MTETTLRRTKTGVYGISGGYYSFEVSAAGATLTSRLYSASGAFDSVRDTQAMSPAYSVSELVGIQEDPLANVGPGSWAWRSATGAIFSWDVEGGTLNTRAAPAAGIAVSPVAYYAGYLYWWECDIGASPLGQGAPPRDWNLMRATCDLGTVTTVGTVVAAATEPWGTLFEAGEWIGLGLSIALTRDAAITWCSYRSGPPSGPSVAVKCAGRQPLDGSAGSWSDSAIPWIGRGQLLPGASGGGAVGAGNENSGAGGSGPRGLVHKPDSLSVAIDLRWPQSGSWSMADRISQCWVSGDGARALLTGSDDGIAPKVVGAPPTATGGEPAFVLTPTLVDSDLSFGFMPVR